MDLCNSFMASASAPAPISFEDFSPYLKDPNSITEFDDLDQHQHQPCHNPRPWNSYWVAAPIKQMTHKICNHCLRFMLTSSEDANELMENIKSAILTVEIGGQIIMRVPMNINLLVLDELVRLKRRTHGVRIVSAAELYDSDLDNYMYIDLLTGVTYLDVPLLFEFFMYGQDIGNCEYSNIVLNFQFGAEARPYISAYMIPEATPAIAKVKADAHWSILIMGCNTYLETSSSHAPKTRYTVSGGITKFIIVTVPTLPNALLPEITGVTINMDDADDNDSYSLDPTYFYVRDLSDRRVYVISPDPETDMRDWVKVVDESKYGKRYPPVKLTWADIVIDFDCAPDPYIQVDQITQNILCGMGGVAGLRFSN